MSTPCVLRTADAPLTVRRATAGDLPHLVALLAADPVSRPFTLDLEQTRTAER